MTILWQIELFGGLQVYGRDRLITRYRSSKTGALLAFLAFYSHRSHPRETLIELLWPEAEADAGRLSLRVALNSLRRQLEPPGVPAGRVLIAEHDCIRLHPAAITTDVADFETALKVASRKAPEAEGLNALMRAIEVYRGELLAGFYDDWILRERERLAQLWLQALDRIGAALYKAGDLEKAIAYELRAVAADPLREESSRALIGLYLAAGRPADALDCYRTLERLLKKHLDITPAESTRSLVAPWLGRRNALRARAARRPPPPPTREPLSLESPVEDAGPPRASLPPLLTRFFGREQERACLETLLAPEPREKGGLPPEAAPRLLTLTGSGGSGKTRLALEVARRLSPAFDAAVWFVPLADVREAARIPEALLHALSVPRSPHVDPLTQAAAVLACRPALLVLDNYEHLVESGGAWIGQLLEQAPALRCLVTSRRRLGLEGEREIPLRPLPAPRVGETAEPVSLLAFPSVQMFVDRAQAVRPDFQITPGNAAAVATLVARLEGIPLAIELAAAWVQTLTPAQMVARLEDRFALLVSRNRYAPSRHRTLRETLEWGYGLLTPDLQRFLARLSVFRGGWTLEAVQPVCQEPEALALLTELRERSLVLADEQGMSMRYRLLETVREFVRQQVSQAEWAALQERHAVYYLSLLEPASRGLRGPEHKRCLAEMAAEYANGMAALEASADRECGLRLAAAFAGFWQLHGQFIEGSAWLQRTLLANPGAPTSVRARAVCGLAALSFFLDPHEHAEALCKEGLRLCMQIEDPQEVAEAVKLLANPRLICSAHAMQPHLRAFNSERESRAITAFLLARAGRSPLLRGAYAEAEALYQRSLALYRELGDRQGVAILLRLQGDVAIYQGDYAGANRWWNDSLETYRQIDDQAGVATMLGELGYLAYRQADYARAEPLIAESLALHCRMGYRRGIASSLWLLANVTRCRGDYPRATALLEEVLEIRWQLDCERCADTLSALGAVAYCQGDLVRARALQEEALAIRRQKPDKLDIALALNRLGVVALYEGHETEAARLLEEALALSREMNSQLGIALCLLGLGRLSCRQGHYAEASARLTESLRLFHKIPDRKGFTDGLEALAALRVAQHNMEKAARLYGAAEVLREHLGTPLPPCDRAEYQRRLARLRATLGKQALALAWAEGRALSYDQSVQYGLGTSDS